MTINSHDIFSFLVAFHSLAIIWIIFSPIYLMEQFAWNSISANHGINSTFGKMFTISWLKYGAIKICLQIFEPFSSYF